MLLPPSVVGPKCLSYMFQIVSMTFDSEKAT